jgi:predicted PurR-regulated permease PerM
VQRRAVELPPVLTITAQVGLSWAAGSLGLLVAVPLVAVVMVAVQMLYVEDTLRDRLESDVEASARQEVEKDVKGALRGVLSQT